MILYKRWSIQCTHLLMKKKHHGTANQTYKMIPILMQPFLWMKLNKLECNFILISVTCGRITIGQWHWAIHVSTRDVLVSVEKITVLAVV